MNSRPFPPVWYPGEEGYKEHMDRYIFSLDNISAIKEQTNQFKNSINRQARDLSNAINISNEKLVSSLDDGFNQLSHNIIASNEQLVNAIDDGLNQLAQINEMGFFQVTSAIQKLNSNMNYIGGIIIQKLEYQNNLLNGILTTLQEPFETKVKEYYHKGCLFIRQGFLEGAIDCFKESIALKMGEYFFPSYYQLGRIYLSGVSEGINFINPQDATKYLLKANEYGNRIVKTDSTFKPILADCKFYLSQSYYSQLLGNKNPNEFNLLENALKYCKEATEINPKLSQGWYYLAKYASYRIGLSEKYRTENEIENLLIWFLNAVEIDRNYLFSVEPKNEIFFDKALKPVSEDIFKLIQRLIEIKRKDATILLNKAHNYIKLLDEKNISNSKYFDDFKQLKDIVNAAQTDFQTNTYIGFDDCIIKLKEL